MYQAPPPSYSTPDWPGSPWLKVWLSPRSTIRALINYDPNYQLVPLMALLGLSAALDLAIILALGEHVRLLLLIAAMLLLAPAIGFVLLAIQSVLIWWIGHMLGGAGSVREVRAAVAWSSVPTIATSILWLPQLLRQGSALFHAMPQAAALPANLQLVQIIATIWAFILSAICLSEAHRFSVPRSLATLLAAGMLLIFVATLVSILG